MSRIIAEHIDQYREENGIVKCYTVGELIRCKDCVWFEADDIETYCPITRMYSVDVNHYCSWAERKEES